jgi:hypothetical protein
MDGVGPRGELHGSKNAERPGGSCGATGALVLKNLAMSYFPAGTARSIIGAAELNCRVRNGNGWDLRAIVARKCCATICTGVLTGFVCVCVGCALVLGAFGERLLESNRLWIFVKFIH